MAKVMVSLPDELLAEVDAEARRRGTTRSGLLRQLAADALRRRGGLRAARIERVMGDGVAHGGDVSALIKAHRPGE